MKQATTIKEQIEKLKIRGLILDIGEDKTKEILSDIGYFRLGFYCFPFETNYPQFKYRTHQYKQGAKISDVISLYYLDVDLRNILAKYINRIEINFRTNIVYRVSNKYKNCSTWFVDTSAMERKFIDNFEYELYTDKFKKHPVIKNHHYKYINDKYAPAWKTLEFFTFGAILTIYKNLKDEILRQEIARQYNIRNDKILQNYLQSIVEIRNICAHGGVLFDHTLNKALKIGLPANIENQNKSKLYSVIQVMLFLLKNISKNRAIDLEKEINALFDRYKNNEIIYPLITNCIGR